MKIYSLLLVKNEADIIRVSLEDACRWSDKVIVIDNGSTDGTWETILRMSATEPRVIPYMRYEGPYHIGLRAKAFRAFRNEMKGDDWWCVRLDADELYPGDVRAFLEAIPRRYRTVKKESTDYILTRNDIQTHTFTGDFAIDRPFITHALAQHRRERRFMRHSFLYLWPERWRYPHPWGRVFPDAIPVEHYQYRSPQQMERRYKTRQQAKAEGCGSFKHETGQSWTDYLPEEESVIHSGRNLVKIVGKDRVVKQFAVPRGWQRLIYSTIRRSKARRSYLTAMQLPGLTPEPLAYHETYHHGLLAESDYVSRLSACTHTFRELRNPDYPNRLDILAQIGRFTAELHTRGFIHYDYSQGNILFEPKEDGNVRIEIVDLNRVRRSRHISCRRGCINFERLDIDAEALSAMGRAYAEARGFDPDKCIRIIQSHRWHKHKKP